MQFEDSETERRPIVRSSLKIRIEGFNESCSEQKPEIFVKYFKSRYFQKNVKFHFFVQVCPNGFNKRTEGWLTVALGIGCPDFIIHPENCDVFTLVVSVIDVEGNSRCPQSFQNIFAEDIMEFTTLENKKAIEFEEKVKYLERIFILRRADEFLVNGTLTIRCDFCSDLKAIIPLLALTKDQIFPLQLSHCSIKKAQTGDLRDSLKPKWNEECCVYDYTSQVLTLPQFHESRKRFGVYGSLPSKLQTNSESKENGANTLEHVWMFDIFDIPSQRILLSLDERQDSLGTRLLKASPVIRRMVETDMRERREKCIELTNVKSHTFKNVLLFLADGSTLFKLKSDLVMDVYAFSHFYDMKDLQRICAESIVKLFEVDEIEKIIDMYSDQYLSGLLESRRLELDESLLKLDDIPCSDCYI